MNFFDAVDSAASSRKRKASGTRRDSHSGILLIDKPEGITSYGVVHKVKRILHVKKAGHCGTLDPFATGVLVVCIGQATRIVDQLLNQDKVYRFSAHLGAETDTQDRTGKVVASQPGHRATREEVEAVLQGFLGPSIQKVPRFSAVKVDGERLYQLARKGIDVDLPSRHIRIERLRLLRYQWPEVDIEVACSKGTYVRRLTSDMGRELGCGAYVKELKRLASGPFTIDRAISLEHLSEVREMDRLPEAIIPMSEALAHLPSLVIEDRHIRERLKDGHLSRQWQEAQKPYFTDSQEPVCLSCSQGSLLALWWPHSHERGNRHLRIFEPQG